MLPEITERVRPPGALSVRYALGYPLGAANDRELQMSIVRRLFALCERTDVPVVDAL